LYIVEKPLPDDDEKGEAQSLHLTSDCFCGTCWALGGGSFGESATTDEVDDWEAKKQAKTRDELIECVVTILLDSRVGLDGALEEQAYLHNNKTRLADLTGPLHRSDQLTCKG